MDLAAGQTLANYEILEVIGRGGMGVVYRARHVNLDRAAAVKVLHEDLTSDREFVERFTQEARLAAQLTHPSIATVYDFGCAEGRYYIAMALADGVPLSRMLTEPIPLDLAVSVLKQVAAALAAAHQAGVVHRDLKPANILVNSRGEVILTDFGIAKSIRSQGLTVAGTLVGTPEYMAPEQALANPVDSRTDIYALGVILYESCVGTPPFQEDTAVQTAMKHVRDDVPTVRERVPDLPGWVDPVVQRCCAKDPDQRFQTVQEFAESLPGEVTPPVPVYPDVMARTGAPDFGSTLTAILRGDEAPEQVITRAPEWEQAIRSTLEREVTVASLDIVGSRSMKAPGQTLVLSYLFEKVRRHIDATCDEKGCFARAWSGDGLAAVFPDAVSAVRAMQQVTRELPSFETPDPTHPFRVRIGIDTGRVMLRETGELGRVTSRVFDTAGHLQKACKPDEICASEAVVRAASLQGEFAPLGQVEDTYVWVWWDPTATHESIERRRSTAKAAAKAQAGAKPPPIAAIVCGAIVLLALAVGGLWALGAARQRNAATATATSSPGSGGTIGAPGPARPAPPGPAAPTGESTPAGHVATARNQPGAATAFPLPLQLGVADIPPDAEVTIVVHDSAGRTLEIAADGVVALPAAGAYELFLYYGRGPGSRAVRPTLWIRDAAGREQSLRAGELWPQTNPQGQEIASRDLATRRVGVVTAQPDGALHVAP